MEFYVYLNGAKRGPFSEEQVRSYLADHLLQPADLASDQSEGGWQPLSAFPRFNAATPPPGSPSATAVISEPIASPAAAPRTQPDGKAADPLPLAAASLGPYSRSTLAPNETPYYKTSLHWIVFARFAALAFILFLFAAIPFAIGVQALTGSELGWFVLPLPAFIMLPPTLAFTSSELVITDRRVLIKTGIVRRQTAEMFVSKVESIAVDQGVLGRVFDYGTVRIRGTGGFEEAFESIAKPLLFRNWVQRLQGGEVPRACPEPAPAA